LHVIGTNRFGVELHPHVEIPRVIFLRLGKYIMVKKERNELVEREVGQVNLSWRFHGKSIAAKGGKMAQLPINAPTG
jgi:hypothetical protein